MAGINGILAFGGGVAQGIESAESVKRLQQQKQDDEYRKLALQTSFEEQHDAYKKKLEADQASQTYSQIASAAGITKANTTNQASYDALKQAQNNPDIAQNTDVTGQPTPSPTNTPQTSVSAPPPQQGDMNSPQGGPVTLSQGSVPITTPNQTPQQGDNTDPLKAPNAQTGDNINPTGGITMPNAPDDLITDSFGNRLTREQAQRATAYGVEENMKLKGVLPSDVAYNLGIGKVLKEDGELGNGISNTGFNKYGFEIGKVPDGLSSPVLPEKFDETRHMSPVQAGKKINYDDQQLAKDRDAAVLASKAATEFALYLSGNEAGDSGSLNKISFIRDFGGALSSTDGTLDSVNKSLTFNIVGFERTPGMRLTQAEFFIAREAMPGRGNTPEANKNIAQFWQAKLQLPQEYAQFKQDYMAANGTWNEAIGQRMFQQYQKDNPIFDPKILENPEKAQMSDFKLNSNRQTLEQYAKNGGFGKLGFLGLKPPATQGNQQATPQATSGQSTTNNVVSYKDYFK